MAELTKLNNAISKALDNICIELTRQKKSYFSSSGKGGWNPLKEDTIAKKRKLYPSNATKFNTATGELRDSLKVYWKQVNSNTVRLFVECNHKYGDEVIKYLTETLGRDFMSFDDDALKLITYNLQRRLK